jgi:hypothetical protein
VDQKRSARSVRKRKELPTRSSGAMRRITVNPLASLSANGKCGDEDKLWQPVQSPEGRSLNHG